VSSALAEALKEPPQAVKELPAGVTGVYENMFYLSKKALRRFSGNIRSDKKIRRGKSLIDQGDR
jgi:hypothetical protein